MTREEAKQVFLSRGYVEVEGGIIYDADKWRESCRVISEWLEQEPCEDAISCEDIEECKELMTDINGDTVYVVRMSDIRQLPPVKPQESCIVPDTNVGDIISKQTVLDTISELNAISFYEAQEDSKECYYEIRQAIKDLSPVKPQEPKWIPVSERLPKTDNENSINNFNVLLWVKNKTHPEREPQIYLGKLRHVDGDDGSRNFWGIETKPCDWTIWGWSYFNEPEVIAWMPLPKPYKGE